ncbi:hypothetical protein LC593_19715 [Nostoc sp. CHAB 5844]|nr:hypothetical protein [Nostoc sp. CHAB 5844]
MSKLKYLNLFVAACGATAIVLGSIIGVKGAIKGNKNIAINHSLKRNSDIYLSTLWASARNWER